MDGTLHVALLFPTAGDQWCHQLGVQKISGMILNHAKLASVALMCAVLPVAQHDIILTLSGLHHSMLSMSCH